MFKNTEEKTAYLFLLPAIIIIVFLIGYPFFYSIYLSVTNTSVGKTGSLIGFLNYTRLFKNAIFRQVLFNSFVFTIGAVSLKLILGMSVALLMQKIKIFSKFIRGAFMLPWVVPPALSALVWWWMYVPNLSVLNWVTTRIGLEKIPWLSDKTMAMIAVIIVHTWIGVPFFAISILSGLISVDSSLYEAADLEGARGYQKFLYIALPLIKPVVAIVLLFSTLMTISEFNIIYIITGGGPMYGTHLLATLAYREGISTGNISRGAAISLFLFPVLFVASYLQLRVVRRSVGRR